MPKYHESVWFNILFLKAQTFACEAKKKEKAGSRLENDPRECIRVDNILKQNVTRFLRVPAPPRLGGGRGEGGWRSPQPAGCHCGLWCRNSANFLIYN